MRKSVFSGKLYEAEFDILNKQIENLFLEGPGDLPIASREKEIYAIITPSCNYSVSGKLFAWAYKEIAESKLPDFYLLIGSCKGDKAYLSLEDFETPFGVVRNMGFSSKNELIVVDEVKHKEARDIEIQLPFLQYVSRSKLDKVRIMPLLIGRECDEKSLKEISNAILSLKDKFVTIISCNLTYFGEKYGNARFKYNIEEEVRNFDLGVMELVKELKFEEICKVNQNSEINNLNVLAVLISILNQDSKFKLLGYGNSSHVIEDKDNFITFASGTFSL